MHQEGASKAMKASELIRSMDPNITQKVAEFREERRQKNLVALFENCAQCQLPLSFRYQKDSPKGLIAEHASCPECLATSPSRIYKIC